MIAAQSLIPNFVQHLRARLTPLFVRRQGALAWDDLREHAASYRQDPELYALLALSDKVQPAQKARVLFHLLAEPRPGLAPDIRNTVDRVAERLRSQLEPEQVLSVFLALRRARANHKHTRRAVVAYLLNHPATAMLAVRRPRAVRDALEHALGRNVARACGRLLGLAVPDERASGYLGRNLLRHAADAGRARMIVRYLYQRTAVDRSALVALGATAPPVIAAQPALERPTTVTATNRGDIAATLVHLCRGGDSPDVRHALDQYVTEAAEGLPRFDGTVALVLDASASTRGYGEREFACVSQSQAFRLVLQRCCPHLRVFTVGRGGELPQPDGVTNLADPLLDALETAADVVVIVSDGYENVFAGDLARVVATLPLAGVTTPVLYCHSQFTDKDDLALRRPAPGMPEVAFWHQADFAGVLWEVFSRAGNGRGEAFVRQFLRGRLDEMRGDP